MRSKLITGSLFLLAGMLLAVAAGFPWQVLAGTLAYVCVVIGSIFVIMDLLP